MVDAAAMNPREPERRQFLQLLSAWDSAPLTALGGGGLRRFSGLPAERRNRVLLSWCDSRLTQRRAAFQTLRKGVLLMYYMLPGAGGGASPVWEAIDYPGPLGPPDDPPRRALKPLAIEADTELDCDVCVVGSGAGGGTAAGVLATAGLDVVVLEAGDYYDDADFDGGELRGFQRMYMQGGGMASADAGIGLLAGSCLGGGTVVNYSTSFATPDDVREEWAAYGVPAFRTDEYTRSIEAVSERLGINQEHSRPSRRDEKMQRGLETLGWHSDFMPRNVRGCDQGQVCGYCGYGCRLGAKQSVVKTWLADAYAAGARLVVRTRAERVTAEGGAARGVQARTLDGHRVSVRCRAVVAAAGALHTPALLRRSSLTNPNIGRHLKLHPVTVIWGVFDEELRPWEGTMQAI
jgi:glycine/D-amino acid oxidase-like deaminating enzyme